jgi:hypothetical protein
MVVEIVTDVPKDRARSIHDAADAAAWDRLAADIARIRSQGQIIVCDND